MTTSGIWIEPESLEERIAVLRRLYQERAQALLREDPVAAGLQGRIEELSGIRQQMEAGRDEAGRDEAGAGAAPEADPIPAEVAVVRGKRPRHKN